MTRTKTDRRELTPEDRARIASQAQAAAHKALRDKDPEAYRREYQRAKRELTKQALEAT